METHIVAIALVMLLYCLFSSRIGALGITMPMAMIGFGLFMGIGGQHIDLHTATIFHDLAEFTLALLLFADATMLRRSALSNIGRRTLRMLLIGLPLAIAIGAAINIGLLPGWSLWEACLLAALLAPTDAALGQSIQSNPRIPKSLRDTTNAESGLNDGLALPFVIFFAGLAAGSSDPEALDHHLLLLVATQISIGALVGLAGGFAIGKLRNFVLDRALMDENLGQVLMLVLVGFIFFAAEHTGGNSFVAVFLAGTAFANASTGSVNHARHFLEGNGQFLAMLSFFFIGALFVPEALEHLTLPGLIVVVLSLIIVRPVAIALSLIGTGTPARERLFYGWFGPRGLATALFAVFVVMDFDGVGQVGPILVIAMTAVLISAFVHGITAKFAADIFNLD